MEIARPLVAFLSFFRTLHRILVHRYLKCPSLSPNTTLSSVSASPDSGLLTCDTFHNPMARTDRQIWQQILVMKARKESGVAYPNLYATDAEAKADPKKHVSGQEYTGGRGPDAQRFNCVQRANQNSLENVTFVLPLSLFFGMSMVSVAQMSKLPRRGGGGAGGSYRTTAMWSKIELTIRSFPPQVGDRLHPHLHCRPNWIHCAYIVNIASFF